MLSELLIILIILSLISNFSITSRILIFTTQFTCMSKGKYVRLTLQLARYCMYVCILTFPFDWIYNNRERAHLYGHFTN